METDEKIGKRFEEWLKKGETRLDDLLDDADSHWDSFIKEELLGIENDADSDPGKAYGRLVSLTGFAGDAAKRHPLLARIITAYVGKFVEILKKLKHSLGATSFTISVGTPFSLSVSLSFS